MERDGLAKALTKHKLFEAGWPLLPALGRMKDLGLLSQTSCPEQKSCKCQTQACTHRTPNPNLGHNTAKGAYPEHGGCPI